MNILVTLNNGYVNPLCVMLTSLCHTNKGEKIDLYVAHSSLTLTDFAKIEQALLGSIHQIHSINVDDNIFNNFPILKRTSKETYYRLLAPMLLPKNVERILYIDPDTVVINSIKEFYNTDFDGNLIIGAKHFDGIIDIWNRGRLGIKKSKRYINAGVMLLNIEEMRKDFDLNKTISLIKKYKHILFLADQDVINILYDGKIKIADELKINLDERTFNRMLKKRPLNDALGFVRSHTAIIHYNGKEKPWKPDYNGKLQEHWLLYNALYLNRKKNNYDKIA